MRLADDLALLYLHRYNLPQYSGLLQSTAYRAVNLRLKAADTTEFDVIPADIAGIALNDAEVALGSKCVSLTKGKIDIKVLNQDMLKTSLDLEPSLEGNKLMKKFFEPCYLLKHHLIPKEEMDRVFKESYSASAEIGPDFMCFEEPYQAAVRIADKNSIILDLGCAYAPQAYYFSKCKHYIGVDLPMMSPENPFNYPNIKPETRFHPDNARFYVMTIQQFIQTVLPKLKLDINHVIAVCSAVPDVQARQLVIDTFPVHYVSYPGQRTYSTLPPPKKTLEEALGLILQESDIERD